MGFVWEQKNILVPEMKAKLGIFNNKGLKRNNVGA